MLFVGILLVVGQGAIACAALYVAKCFGEYAASNALLSSQIIQALAEIARIKAESNTVARSQAERASSAQQFVLRALEAYQSTQQSGDRHVPS